MGQALSLITQMRQLFIHIHAPGAFGQEEPIGRRWPTKAEKDLMHGSRDAMDGRVQALASCLTDRVELIYCLNHYTTRAAWKAWKIEHAETSLGGVMCTRSEAYDEV